MGEKNTGSTKMIKLDFLTPRGENDDKTGTILPKLATTISSSSLTKRLRHNCKI